MLTENVVKQCIYSILLKEYSIDAIDSLIAIIEKVLKKLKLILSSIFSVTCVDFKKLELAY